MASSLPASAATRTRRRSEPEETESESDTDTNPYRITGIVVRKFVLSFLVLYIVLAVSIFSVLALQDQSPVLIKDSLEKEIEPGKEVNFSISVKNPSILEKECTLTLEKELPSGWMASLCDESQCFYESCTITLEPLQKRQFTVNMISGTGGQSGTAQLLMHFEGTQKEAATFTVRTRRKAHFTAELLENNPDLKGVSFTVRVANTGNVPDQYTVFVPSGVTARVSEDTMTLQPGESKDIIVYIEQKESINTSLVVKSDTGLSETLYLICERTFSYDFELYSAREYYLDQKEAEISFDIINMGNVSDTYSVDAVCLSSGWEAHVYPETIVVGSKRSERMTVYVKRGEGRSTSVIITATSESRLSKNIKMSIYVQETQGKTVLAEYFTGTWCYVCSYGERALRQLAEDYENLVVLVYHLKDDIETPGSQKRTQTVYGFTDTVSTLVVNGTKHVYYTSGGEGTIYFRYKKIIEELLAEIVKAEMYISAHTQGDTAYVAAEIHPYVSGAYNVYFVLYKNDFAYRGETKQYIVRDVADPQRIYLTEGGEIMVSCEFTLPKGESFQGYGVVVIIQHPETLEVIQASSYML